MQPSILDISQMSQGIVLEENSVAVVDPDGKHVSITGPGGRLLKIKLQGGGV